MSMTDRPCPDCEREDSGFDRRDFLKAAGGGAAAGARSGRTPRASGRGERRRPLVARISVRSSGTARATSTCDGHMTHSVPSERHLKSGKLRGRQPPRAGGSPAAFRHRALVGVRWDPSEAPATRCDRRPQTRRCRGRPAGIFTLCIEPTAPLQRFLLLRIDPLGSAPPCADIGFFDPAQRNSFQF